MRKREEKLKDDNKKLYEIVCGRTDELKRTQEKYNELVEKFNEASREKNRAIKGQKSTTEILKKCKDK